MSMLAEHIQYATVGNDFARQSLALQCLAVLAEDVAMDEDTIHIRHISLFRPSATEWHAGHACPSCHSGML